MPRREPSENITHLMTLSHHELVFRLLDHIMPNTTYIPGCGMTNIYSLNNYTLAVLITLLRGVE